MAQCLPIHPSCMEGQYSLLISVDEVLYPYNSLNGDFFVPCRLPPPSALEMLIPANAVGKVMGKGGANLANIRKVCSAFNIILYYFSMYVCVYAHFLSGLRWNIPF